jgi:hypothetical protein
MEVEGDDRLNNETTGHAPSSEDGRRCGRTRLVSAVECSRDQGYATMAGAAPTSSRNTIGTFVDAGDILTVAAAKTVSSSGVTAPKCLLVFARG